MTDIKLQKIKDRIEKLLALGQSPNEHEADLAMSNAQKLLAKYNLSMSDVTSEEIKSEVGQTIFEVGKRQNAWRTNLLNGIAQSNYCELIITTIKGSGYRLTVIGKSHNVEIVKSMFDYLIDAINLWAKKNGGKGTSAKNSYRHGMVQGLIKRLNQIKRELEENGFEVDGEKCTAVMVIKNSKELEKANEDFMRKEFENLKTSRQKTNIKDMASFGKGMNDSNNIGLNPQIAAMGR